MTTAADGSFSIGALRPGESYDIVTFMRDRPASRREGVGAPADGLEIVLPSPGRISGRVVDAQTQTPVTDFQVSFAPDRSSGGGGFGPGGGGRGGGGGRAGLLAALGGGRGDRQALHTDDGGFVLDDVPAGAWEVVVQAEGYQTARVGGITLDEGGKRDGVDVRLRRGASIQGQVLDANSGQPVLDAAITLRRPGGAGAPALAADGDARTNSDGRFAVAGLAAGSYTVMARHPDYADNSALVDVKDAPVTADLRLAPGGSVGGTVLSETNAPLPGATVTLGAGGGLGRGAAFAGGQTTISDDSGRFRFTHVTAGRYAVAASLRSRQTTPVELVLQAGEARENLVLSLGAGARIHGVVSGLPSSLRGNVNVSASGPDGYFTSARAATDGSYEVSGAPAGPINLRATASDATGSTRSATSQVSIADGQVDLEADITFETGFTLSGTVTRAGQAVADATVSAGLQGGGGRMASARTNDSGAYRLDGLLQGSYSVTAAAANGRPQRQTATISDDTTLDFVLPSARLAGVVIEAGSQQPLPDATVQAAPQDAAGPAGRGAATDSNGRFSIDGLEPQPYVVSARKVGYQVESKTVTPAEDGGGDVVLELVRGDGIGLEVRDAQFGVPVRAAQARAVDAQGAVAFAGGVMLDGDGRGEIPSLLPGSYLLTLYPAGYAPAMVAATSPSPHVLVAVSPGGA
ncbi:MAG TPA: carboxypeptidase regulatory-like domain-containing protein, partial [Actinomycetota bacterium]|nr:carboxypeptidase regulatory-like domain-containing protein [Actinomycetota bacterium]